MPRETHHGDTVARSEESGSSRSRALAQSFAPVSISDTAAPYSGLVKYFTHRVVVDRWVYGSMGYVVGIDVDHPAIGCVKE